MQASTMAKLIIFGAGGFGREVQTAARGRGAVLADDHAKDALRFDAIASADEVVIAISSSHARREIATRNYRWGQVVAPTAVIGDDVVIGEGAIFCDFTMVTARARIGRHFHCNIYSYVAHDCVVGDFVTFAPKVSINGNVHIGDGAYIGAGAIVKNGTPDRPLRIGEGATIGCGAVVTRDVPAHTTVVGNPAKPLLPKLVAA